MAAPAGPDTIPAPTGQPSAGAEPNWQTIGRNIFKGQEYQKNQLPDEIAAEAGAFAARLQGQANQLINAPNVTPDQARQRLTQIDPDTAYLAENVADNTMSLDRIGSRGQAGANYRTMVGMLARKLNPDWNENQYALVEDYQRSGSRPQVSWGRVAPMANAGQQVLEDLKNLPADPDGSQMQTAVSAFYNDKVVGNPAYAALMNDWLKYNIDANVLQTGAGQGEGEVMITAKNIPYYSQPAKFQAAIIHDAKNAVTRVNHLYVQWQQIGGHGNPVGYVPDEVNGLKALAAMPDPSQPAQPTSGWSAAKQAG